MRLNQQSPPRSSPLMALSERVREWAADGFVFPLGAASNVGQMGQKTKRQRSRVFSTPSSGNLTLKLTDLRCTCTWRSKHRQHLKVETTRNFNNFNIPLPTLTPTHRTNQIWVPNALSLGL